MPTISSVIAFCGVDTHRPERLSDTIIYCQSGDIDGLKKIIDNHLTKTMRQIPLNGLVLTGGKSTRMHTDKAALQYHGKTQSEFCCELLSRHCDAVFISNRKDQALVPGQDGLPQIHDIFDGFGPLSGILTALHEYPGAAWLVVACDLPFIDSEIISTLVRKRNPHKIATAFKSTHDEFPEPLCTIYEPKSIFCLMQFVAMGYHCPRKVLINSDVQLLKQDKENRLVNINYPDEYEEAKQVIGVRQ